MSDVKRWRVVMDWCPVCGACADDPPNDEPCEACEVRGEPLASYDGEVVPAADFDALLAENARLREAGEALASLVDALVQYRIAAGATEADPVVAALSAWREAVGDE